MSKYLDNNILYNFCLSNKFIYKDENITNYSFALEPESYKPSGSVELSRLNAKRLGPASTLFITKK